MDLSKISDEELREEVCRRGYSMTKPLVIKFSADDFDD